MKNFLIFLLGLLLGIVLFAPKENLYYTAQKFLAKNNIYVNSDVKSGIDLTLLNATVYQNGIDFAEIEKVKILPLVVFNEIVADNIKINLQNYKISNLKIRYSIINPIKIFINGDSNFGRIDGEVNLLKRFVKVYVLNLTNSNLKSFLKKDDKGYFYYAKF